MELLSLLFGGTSSLREGERLHSTERSHSSRSAGSSQLLAQSWRPVGCPCLGTGRGLCPQKPSARAQLLRQPRLPRAHLSTVFPRLRESLCQSPHSQAPQLPRSLITGDPEKWETVVGLAPPGPGGHLELKSA